MRQPGRARGVIGAFAMVVATTLAVDAAAQQQLRLPRSSVEIDWSVLDELDARPTAAPRLSPPTRPAARTSRTAPATSRAAAPAPTAQAAKAPRPAARAAAQDGTSRDPVRLQPPRDRQASGAAPGFTPPAEPPTFSDKAPEPRPPAAVTTSPAAPPPSFSAPPPPPPPTVATPAPPSAPAAPPAAPAPTPSVAATPSPPAPPPAAVPAPPPAAPAAAPPPPAPAAPRTAVPAPAPTPPTPAAPAAAAPAPAAPQVAALPPASDGRIGRLDFAGGAADLPVEARETLDKAVAVLRQDESSRLQIVAYATGGDDSGSQARRLSLSRALAVRSYLIDQGVRSTRMDVRALGNRSPDGPADRVDIVLVRR